MPGACLVRYFQLNVNSNIFIILFEDFRADIDYNSLYFEMVNDHYILDISNDSATSKNS